MLMSDSFPGHDRNKLCMVSQVPLGVVLAIPPFNYPGASSGCLLPAASSKTLTWPARPALSVLQ